MSVAQNEWRNMLFADENTLTNLLSTMTISTTTTTSTLIEHKYLHDRCNHISCRLVSFYFAVAAVVQSMAIVIFVSREKKNREKKHKIFALADKCDVFNENDPMT